jgi:outer membrane immunogenic protein
MSIRAVPFATAIVSVALAAEAQDLSTFGTGSDFSGRFIGLTGGAIRSTGEASRGFYDGVLIPLDVRNGLFPDSIGDESFAATAGVTLGYTIQRSGLAGGVELDYAVTDLDVSATFSRVDPNPNPMFNGVNTNTAYYTNLESLTTLRVRGGRVLGETWVYGTAGVAMGRVMNEFTLEIPELGYSSPEWKENEDRYGYALGAGIERPLSERLSLKVEALYFDLEDAVVKARDPVTFNGEAINYHFDNAGVIGRIGVVFRF